MSISGSIVSLTTPTAPGPPGTPWIPPNYLVDPAQATKVVQELKEIGIKYFLFFAETLDQYRIIGTAINTAKLQFFSDERWSFDNLVAELGYFDPIIYRQTRIAPFLLPLKQEFPTSFIGFHFKDEPGLIHFNDLSKLKDCLGSQLEFQDMKVFVNLYPIHANDAALSGQSPGLGTTLTPSEFGMDCVTGAVIDGEKVKFMVEGYERYVKSARDSIRPDYLCFDLYPFYGGLENCSGAREFLLSENLKFISKHAWINRITPVAYLQNFQRENEFYVNFHHLRWVTSWALAFGIKEFANFISHDGVLDPKRSTGLLNSQNEKTKLGVDQMSTFGFTRHIQEELRSFRFHRFVAPFQGFGTGDLVGWLPSAEILAGEYLSNDDGQAMVFFARRGIEGQVHSEVGFTSWYSKIEQLNVKTGEWILVAENSNGIKLTLWEFPGALYRLTKPEARVRSPKDLWHAPSPMPHGE